MGKAKKILKLRKGFKHKSGGNCWEGIVDQDVCSVHDEARGDCDRCPRCPACDNMNLATSLAAPDRPSLALVPDPLYEFLPTASKTDLLFACTWPFGRKLRRGPVGERTRFGSAFHQVMEGRLANRTRPLLLKAAAGEWDVNLDELTERVDEAEPVVRTWLSGGNMWGLNFTKAGLKLEISVAYNPATGEAREIPGGPGEHHDYPGRRPGEIPGTADVVSILVTHRGSNLGHPIRTLLVLDHKSGWNVAADWQPQTPAESGQLRTLALALATLFEADQVVVAFFHARSGARPVILEDMLQASDLAAHRKALRSALSNIGNGWMRPGPWCSFCPAYMVCPTQTTTLTELKRTSGVMTSEKVGAIHQALATYRGLAEILGEEMRTWVKYHGPGVRPDGQYVDLIPRSRTTLSQASIVRALGPLKGKALIEKLRKLGCVTETENLELRAVRR
jgi:hypothetical protein